MAPGDERKEFWHHWRPAQTVVRTFARQLSAWRLAVCAASSDGDASAVPSGRVLSRSPGCRHMNRSSAEALVHRQRKKAEAEFRWVQEGRRPGRLLKRPAEPLPWYDQATFSVQHRLHL